MRHSAVFELIRHYARLVPISDLKWPSETPVCEVQQYLIDNILDNAHFTDYPPTLSYQKRFWKWVIENIEKADESADDKVYEKLTHLICQGTSLEPYSFIIEGGAPQPSYITHYWPPKKKSSTNFSIEEYLTCTLLESRTTIESGTTGLRTWNASLALANYLSMNPSITKHRVLELGCGSGFLGIITAQLQQIIEEPNSKFHELVQKNTQLWLTDVNEQVLQRCQSNISLPCNGITTAGVRYATLDWSDVLNDALRPKVQNLLRRICAEVIVGADLVYDTSIIPALIEVLRIALSNSSDPSMTTKIAYIAATVRNIDTVSAFRETVLKIFDVTEEDISTDGNSIFTALSPAEGKQPVKLFILKESRSKNSGSQNKLVQAF